MFVQWGLATEITFWVLSSEGEYLEREALPTLRTGS